MFYIIQPVSAGSRCWLPLCPPWSTFSLVPLYCDRMAAAHKQASNPTCNYCRPVSFRRHEAASAPRFCSAGTKANAARALSHLKWGRRSQKFVLWLPLKIDTRTLLATVPVKSLAFVLFFFVCLFFPSVRLPGSSQLQMQGIRRETYQHLQMWRYIVGQEKLTDGASSEKKTHTHEDAPVGLWVTAVGSLVPICLPFTAPRH